MCNLGSDHRCQNFLMCTEYTVTMEYSHVSEIFHFGGSGKASGDRNFLTRCIYRMFVGFGFVS